jgi:hypothetical protein
MFSTCCNLELHNLFPENRTNARRGVERCQSDEAAGAYLLYLDKVTACHGMRLQPMTQSSMRQRGTMVVAMWE